MSSLSDNDMPSDGKDYDHRISLLEGHCVQIPAAYVAQRRNKHVNGKYDVSKSGRHYNADLLKLLFKSDTQDLHVFL